MVQALAPFQAFRTELQQRTPKILRGCMASSASFSPIKNGRFLVMVSWTNKDGTEGSHKKEYSAGGIFITNGQLGVKLKRSVCRTAGELIQEVQKVRARG